MCKHNEHIHWDLAHHSMEDSHTKYIQNPNQSKAKQADHKKKDAYKECIINFFVTTKKKRKENSITLILLYMIYSKGSQLVDAIFLDIRVVILMLLCKRNTYVNTVFHRTMIDGELYIVASPFPRLCNVIQ